VRSTVPLVDPAAPLPSGFLLRSPVKA